MIDLTDQGKQIVRRLVPHALLYLPRAVHRHKVFLTTHLTDALGLRGVVRRPSEHLEAAMEWLARAQDATGSGGVSASWSNGQWQAAYPETTGYIIETLFDYAEHSGDASYRDRAIRAATWELDVQLPNGAFPSGTVAHDPVPTVFNTGQVLFGLCRAYRETGESPFLSAAQAAGNWLVGVQDRDGSWRRHLTPMANNPVHAYNSRTAWALVELYRLTDDERYRRTAEQNVDWTLTQQQDNGWIDNVATNRGAHPLTHFIAYTIRGILESGHSLGRQQYVDAAILSLRGLLTHERDGHLPAGFDRWWHPVHASSCLTGSAQTAIICQRLDTIAGERSFLPTAQRLTRYLMSTQNLSHRESGIRGGIKGSHPVYGYYSPYVILNWATKFFAEALLGQLGNQGAAS